MYLGFRRHCHVTYVATLRRGELCYYWAAPLLYKTFIRRNSCFGGVVACSTKALLPEASSWRNIYAQADGRNMSLLVSSLPASRVELGVQLPVHPIGAERRPYNRFVRGACSNLYLALEHTTEFHGLIRSPNWQSSPQTRSRRKY